MGLSPLWVIRYRSDSISNVRICQQRTSKDQQDNGSGQPIDGRSNGLSTPGSSKSAANNEVSAPPRAATIAVKI
jgi:hypothetical protein